MVSEKEQSRQEPNAETKEAQELIALVYGQIAQLRENGKEATGIVVPPRLYRLLQDYRSTLGEIQEGLPDYIGRYDLFGIPLYTDTGDRVVIRSRRMESVE